MRITEIRAENFKRLKAVHVELTDGVIQVTGANGQGKSSFLDLIPFLIGGKDASPQKPLRNGAKDGFAECTLSNGVTIRATINKTGRGTLTVTAEDGSKIGSPQALLDAIWNDRTFDPVAFKNMKPKEQMELLKDLLGIDFTALDTEREESYKQRTVVGRDMKAKQAVLENTPIVNAPNEEVSVTELSKALQEANEANATFDGVKVKTEAFGTRLAVCVAEIDELQARLAVLQQEKDELEANVKKGKAWLAKHEPHLVDTAGLIEQINSAEETNKKVRAKQERSKLKKEVDAIEQEYKNLDARIAEIDEEKRKIVAEADMPLPGMAFSDEGITIDDVPLAQISAADQLKLSVKMGFLMNPELKVLLIRDGSLLDSKSLALITQLAAEEDEKAQVIIERVDESGKIGIVFEDGEIIANNEAA
jgi:predicted ATP-dependent endonuclease of OLD family